jgi:inner membrane protein
VLPFVLTGLMLALDRSLRRLTRSTLPSTVSARELLLLAGVSILSHPILDTLNTYGVRWLMPFDGRWFYGDVLYIIDPVLWFALTLGVVLSRRQRGGGLLAEPTRPARIALALVALYVGGMTLSGLAARRVVADELVRRGGGPVDALMLSPRPAAPFRRIVVAAQGDRYLVGDFGWFDSPRLERDLRIYQRERPSHPAVAIAESTVVGRRFLGWARFPTYQVEERGDEYTVNIVDLRYAERPGIRFGAVSIPVKLP